MKKGTDFEVSKEVFERAKANSINQEGSTFYLTDSDISELFSASVFCGYGLYDCVVREEDGKYICSYWIGDSCD